MAGFNNRALASKLMDKAGVDAMVVCEPEGFQYVTGVNAGPASFFRRAGAVYAVIPADPSVPLGAVVTDLGFAQFRARNPDILLRSSLAWMEQLVVSPQTEGMSPEARIEATIAEQQRPNDFARPETFDIVDTTQKLRELLAEMGLQKGILAFDQSFIPIADMEAIAPVLTGFQFINGSRMLEQLKLIKNQDEIALLREGISLTEAGLDHMIKHGKAGLSQSDFIALIREGVRAQSLGSDHVIKPIEYVSVAPFSKQLSEPVIVGDALKCDITCAVDGYTSDMSRNFVFGTPSYEQQRLHDICEEAFKVGRAHLRPGHTFGDVYAATAQSLAAQGLPSVNRGHFGHSVGLSVFVEQWPFISANSPVLIEPNMVLSFEVPIYVEGLVSYNLESQFLITPNGPETMNRLPTSLTTIG